MGNVAWYLLQLWGLLQKNQQTGFYVMLIVAGENPTAAMLKISIMIKENQPKKDDGKCCLVFVAIVGSFSEEPANSFLCYVDCCR